MRPLGQAQVGNSVSDGALVRFVEESSSYTQSEHLRWARLTTGDLLVPRDLGGGQSMNSTISKGIRKSAIACT